MTQRKSKSLWRHIFGKDESGVSCSDSDEKIETPRTKQLRDEMTRLHKIREDAVEQLAINDEKLTKGQEVRRRIAKIKLRDKARSILVIPVDENKSNLSYSLLECNPSAKVTFAKSIEEARDIYSKRDFDMVYLIADFGRCGQYGPCFVSVQNDCDDGRRDQIKGTMARLEPLIDEFQVAEEQIIVCGTNELDCPLADRIYAEPGRSGIFNV